MNCEGFGATAGVDPRRRETPPHRVGRQSEAPGQGIPQRLSPLGEGRPDDGVEAPLVRDLDAGS